jgi:hypothetical protein
LNVGIALIVLSPEVKDSCRANLKIPRYLLAKIATFCRFMISRVMLEGFLKDDRRHPEVLAGLI